MPGEFNYYILNHIPLTLAHAPMEEASRSTPEKDTESALRYQQTTKLVILTRVADSYSLSLLYIQENSSSGNLNILSKNSPSQRAALVGLGLRLS